MTSTKAIMYAMGYLIEVAFLIYILIPFILMFIERFLGLDRRR